MKTEKNKRSNLYHIKHMKFVVKDVVLLEKFVIFSLDQDVMDALKNGLRSWRRRLLIICLLFKQKNDETHQVGEGTFNDWCIGEISEIVGKRCTPHNFRRSRATNLVCHDHRSLETAQKLLGHESSETTQIYVTEKTQMMLMRHLFKPNKQTINQQRKSRYPLLFCHITKGINDDNFK